MSLNVNFVPLSFITTKEEILKQIKNSVLFSHLLGQCEETTLNHYLESTQYGYTASALDSGSHKLVRITDINSGQVDWKNVPYCNCENDTKYLLKENDILIARTGGTTGKSYCVSYAPEKSVYASYLIRLRLKSDVEIDFINSFLNSYIFWSQIVEMKSGSAMPNVNAEKLKTLKLPKCDNNLQRAIVASIKENQIETDFKVLFNKVDSIEGFFNNKNILCTELTHQLDIVKQLRQAFLREAMQGKLTAKWRTENSDAEPASELLKKIKAEKEKLVTEGKLKKQKPLPAIKENEIPFEIPESWEWCRLGDITTLITDGKHGDCNDEKNSGYYFLSAKDIQNGKFIYSGARQITYKDFYETHRRTDLEPGDLCVVNTGATIGKTAFAPEIELTRKTTFQKSVAVIKVINRYINMKFVEYFIINETPKLLKTSRGSAINNLLLGDMRNVQVPLPPLSEQQQIVIKLDELMQYCDDLEKSIKTSQQQNEMLLQQVLREALEPDKDKTNISV